MIKETATPHRVLLLADLQNDFCAGSTFTVPGDDSTVEAANRLIDWCQSCGEAVITSQGWYPANHGSFTSQHGVEPYTPDQLDGLPQTFWPGHCAQDSEGAQLRPLLGQEAIAAVLHRGENPLVDSYSTFLDNGRWQKTFLDDWLRDHEVDELIIMGLAADYCMKFTMLDTLQLGYKVSVVTDGCRDVDIQPRDSTRALVEISAVGATLYVLADWEETQG